MKRRRRRGLSFGSVVMIVLTVAVLAGFGMMIPRFTGSESFDQNAAQLAVALDGGVLVTADGAEVELYGNGGNA